MSSSTSTDTADAVALVGDVGGTNARFALVRTPGGRPEAPLTLATADYPDLAAALQAYLAQAGHPAVREAAVAIANPIAGDAVRMTNNHWTFSIEATRRQLGLTRLVLLNDWEALALAAPALPAEALSAVGGGQAVADAPRALIGPGTGLGVASLVRSRRGEWVAIPGEGGHVTLAPTCDREARIIERLWRRWDHVSAERLVSGMGLENLYAAIAALDGVPVQAWNAAEVCRQGLAGSDPQSAEALARFCGLLGSVAGNLALTLGARGGVYIGGGIVPRLGNYFARSPFRAQFEAKGRFRDYLARIPTWVILDPHPALTGAALALHDSPQA
ncbi:glucokinase [Ramlibacter sp. 2FC]|uniref:glucokinase n=1 Tax=Ramlibacter sp. 2FC TaxID=2502188 RepID=UPI0010F6EEB6|nr:glucokinase [Ramlibacter sp. 2FC]